jgi:hypothetical protein
VVVVRDECPYYCLRFPVEDCVFFPLRHSPFSEVRQSRWTMQGPNEESDEGLRGFESSLHGNWVRGDEYCHLVWDAVSSGVHRKGCSWEGVSTTVGEL